MVEAERFNAEKKDEIDSSSANSMRITGPTRRSTKGGWTKEKDQVLANAVKKFNGKNWKRIAELVTGTTDVQCLHRWQKVLDPSLVKGPWSKEEDAIIIEQVEKHGNKKWAAIAKHLPGRIGKQCRERWHNHLAPTIKKDPWTKEEELILIEAHQKFGNKWAEIAKLLPGRTENSIKNTWNCSLKKKLDSGAGAGHLPGATYDLGTLKMETKIENVTSEVTQQSLGEIFSFGKKMDSTSMDSNLDLSLGNSSARESHLQPFKKVRCSFPREETFCPRRQPFGTMFDKEISECDLANNQCKENADNARPLEDSHLKADQCSQLCNISFHFLRADKLNLELDDPSSLQPLSGCIQTCSNSSLDMIGCIGKKGDPYLTPERPLQRAMDNLLSANSLGTVDSRFVGQSKNSISSMPAPEVDKNNKDTEKSLNLEDENHGGLCYKPPDLGDLYMYSEAGTFCSFCSFIQQSSSPLPPYTPAYHLGSSIHRSSSPVSSSTPVSSYNPSYSPLSILRRAARTFKNYPSIIRRPKHHSVPSFVPEEKTDSMALPMLDESLISPPKLQKLDTSPAMKGKRLEYSSESDWE